MTRFKTGVRKTAVAILMAALLLVGGIPAIAETFSAIVSAESMAVYGDPSMSEKLGTLDKYAVVRVVGYSNAVAKISYEGKIGYAKIADMKRVDAVAEKAMLKSAATVYASPDEQSASVNAPEGTKLYLLAESGDWAMVESGGHLGYVKKDAVQKLDEAAQPDATPQPDAGVVQPGQESAVTVRSYDAVTIAETPVYKTASEKGAKLGTLKTGTQVTIRAYNSEGWAYVELNGKRGFCKLERLREGVAATAEPTATFAPSMANARTAKATKKLAVYRTADSNGTKLGTLKKGQAVNVLQTNDGWAYIELKGNYGFCELSGLSVEKAGQTVPAGYSKADITATVVASDARVYSSPNTDAENQSLKLGASLKVVAYNSAWACVQQNGSYGFVAVKALSKAAYTAIDGDGTALQTLLKALLSGGYYDAEPSTSYNAAAIAAIKRFQKACGLEETGVADETMQRILYSGTAPVSALLYSGLGSGDKGDSVSRVQARLYALGYLTRTASLDGDYGSTTVAAVKLFQSASGITATGAADTATLKALYSTEAKKLPSGTKAADATTTTTVKTSSSYLDSVPSGLASVVSSYNSGMSNAEKLEHAIYLAQSKLGRPYVYGATGPEKFDCSGLTTWIFNAVGVSLKRSAYAQGYDDSFSRIDGWQNLKRGDIVFFDTISDSDLSDHAGVYIGEGYFIHASSGAHRVVVSNLTTGYYGRVFSWGRRILN